MPPLRLEIYIHLILYRTIVYNSTEKQNLLPGIVMNWAKNCKKKSEAAAQGICLG